MSFFKRLFGGEKPAASAPQSGEPVAYKTFTIIPMPTPEGGQFRLAADIRGQVDGETKNHRLIRADLFTSAEEAERAAIAKAQRVIDEQGTSLFD